MPSYNHTGFSAGMVISSQNTLFFIRLGKNYHKEIGISASKHTVVVETVYLREAVCWLGRSIKGCCYMDKKECKIGKLPKKEEAGNDLS